MSELKDRLLEALSIREMTAAELSRKSGIDKGSISNYLRVNSFRNRMLST